MERESNIEGVRLTFRKFREAVLSSQSLGVRMQTVEEREAECRAALAEMADNNDFSHLQEVTNIEDKYRRVKQLLKGKKKTHSDQLQLLKKIKLILSQSDQNQLLVIKQGLQSSMGVSSVVPEDVTVPDKSKSIDNFFKKKQKQISKKQASFKRILDSKQFQVANDTLSNKSLSKQSRFSKSAMRRGDDKQKQLKYVIDEHKKMVVQLQSKIKQQAELNQFEKNLLKEEKNRYLGKIEEMENEIEQLYRDNYRLKQLEKTLKPVDSFQIQPLEQRSQARVYEPYVIKTRTNDLNRINNKNKQQLQVPQRKKQSQLKMEYAHPQDYLGSKLQKQKPITAKEFFGRRVDNPAYLQSKVHKQSQNNNNFLHLLGDSFEQKGRSPEQIIHNHHSIQNSKNYSMEQGSRFDTFQMANTLSYVNDSAIGQSRQMVRMSSAACTRNKVAFFKSSLVLVREPHIEIAFKRSQLDEKLSKVRIIFYVNNKSQQWKRVRLDYEFQKDYFKIKVLEKLEELGSNTQGREVIEVSLISKTDLNAVTDLHVQVGDTVYDLWLPLSFIRFKCMANYRMDNDEVEMTVVPDRQFSTFNNMQGLVPIMFGGNDGLQTWAYMHGDSKFGSHTIKLSWRPRELVVETTDKWIDFIGFILHFFK